MMYCVDDFNIYNGKNHNISLQPFLAKLLHSESKFAIHCNWNFASCAINSTVEHKNKEVIMILAALNKNTLCFFYEHEKMVQHRYVAFLSWCIRAFAKLIKDAITKTFA